MAWSPDGHMLAISTQSGAVCFWSFDMDEKLRFVNGHQNHHCHTVAWSPDCRKLVSGGDDGKVNLWDATSMEHIKTICQCCSHVYSVGWSPDGQILAFACNDGNVHLWDTKNASFVDPAMGHKRAVNIVEWSPDGQLLATGSDDNAIRLWDTRSYSLKYTLHTRAGLISSLAWFPVDWMRIGSPHKGTAIGLWCTHTGGLCDSLESHEDTITSLSLSYDKRLLASKSDDGTVCFWKTRSWTTHGVLDEPGKSRQCFASVAFHPLEPIIATLGEGDKVVRIWNYDETTIFVDENECILPLSTHPLQQLNVFICYGKEDDSVVSSLYHRLCFYGFHVWRDKEHILPGMNWELEIKKAIINADVVVICLSESSVDKTGYLQKEITTALELAQRRPEGTIFIIVLRLDDCEIHDRLNHLQYCNYFTVGGFTQLTNALQQRADELNRV